MSPEFPIATHKTVLALKSVFNSEYKKESKKEGIKKKENNVVWYGFIHTQRPAQLYNEGHTCMRQIPQGEVNLCMRSKMRYWGCGKAIRK